MKVIERACRDVVFQGDVMVRRVLDGKVPLEALKQEGEAIIAHSETGHNHVALNAQHFASDDPLVSWLRATSDNPIDIVHRREWDTHEMIRMECSAGEVFEVRLQREARPEGWARVED